MRALHLALLLTGVLMASSCATPASACNGLAQFADGRLDASRELADCLRRTPAGGRLELPPGVYRLHRPLTVSRSMTIVTAGTVATSPGCGESGSRCATLLLDPRGSPKLRGMPIDVVADRVTLDRLTIRGVGPSGRLRGACAKPEQRPLGGGLRVVGVAKFTIRRSMLRDFTCYTALEITPGARDLRIEGNLFGPNGDHRPGKMWTDGLTIHDAVRAIVLDNRFFDNTDVQLVLGGCRSCRVERNRFRHSGAFSSAAFAELMLHAWPNTSGNFTETIVADNDIDCGSQRRCGYGLMVGSAPWYPGRAEGGTVTRNVVRNALMAINIDALTGPMDIRGNEVRASGGRHRSDCGIRDWPAVNVSPGSAKLMLGDPSDVSEGSIDTRGCLLARDEGALSD